MSARERVDIISAYHEVGTYRGAAEICGTTHKTVRRVIERAETGETARPVPAVRSRNYDAVTGVVLEGFCVCWMATAPTLTVPATMTVIAAAVTLSAMLTADEVTAGAAVTCTAAC